MTRSRFLVMAMPSPVVKAGLTGELEKSGLLAPLQGAIFDPANWHQSLSDRFFDPAAVEPLRCACATVRARACTLTWNRIRCEGTHWAFRAYGEPSCFTELLWTVKKAIAEQAYFQGEDLKGHSPHITISYRAPSARMTHRIRPIQWTIDEILLVEGHPMGEHEEHYRYDVIDHWPLQPAPPARQRDLFEDANG